MIKCKISLSEKKTNHTKWNSFPSISFSINCKVHPVMSKQEKEVLSHTLSRNDWGQLRSIHENIKCTNPLTNKIFFILRFDPRVTCNYAQRLAVYK